MKSLKARLPQVVRSPATLKAILDRHGHAVQRSGLVAAGDRFVGGDRFA